MLSVKNVAGGGTKVIIDEKLITDKNVKFESMFDNMIYCGKFDNAIDSLHKFIRLKDDTYIFSVNTNGGNCYKLTSFNTYEPYITNISSSFYSPQSSILVYNDEIHIIGCYNYNHTSGDTSYTGEKTHYKWNGTSWTKVSTLPYGFKDGSAVVYNNEIHILGGGTWYAYQHLNYHYKWNGTAWIKLTNIPIEFSHSFAISYNDEIHILGGSDKDNYSQEYFKNHYIWNDSKYTKLNDLPEGVYNGKIIVYDNKIFFFYSYGYSYYIYNGVEWIKIADIFDDTWKYDTYCLIYKDKLYMYKSRKFYTIKNKNIFQLIT